MTNPMNVEAAVKQFGSEIDGLMAEVGKRIVGHQRIIEGAAAALLAGGHVLLEGVPGVGKTLLVRTFAEALGLSFSRIQFTPDLMPSDITGTTLIADGPEGRRFQFQEGPLFAHVVLADEVNRATPKTQSALLEAMQEQAVTVGRQSHALPSPFLLLATQNPIEMAGTYPLPEAQLDRFLFKLRVLPPSREELHAILDRTTSGPPPAVRAVLGRERILELRRLLREVPVARPVQGYVVALIEASHPQAGAVPLVKRYVRFGSSARGGQAILLGAKVRALRAGRYSPSFEDVRALVPSALGHRILLNFEGEADGVTAEQVVAALLESVPEA